MEHPPTGEPEANRRFIQYCLRSRVDPEALLSAGTLAASKSLDWDRLVSTAQAEALEPLLYAAVRKREIVPPQVEASLARAYQRSRSRNTLLFGELKDILGKLAPLNIPVILLKGSALVTTVYGDAALRPMLDLDFLVSERDIEETLRVIGESGYRSAHPEPKSGNTLTFENEYQMRRSDPIDLLVEPHWSLFDSPYYQYALSPDWFWKSALPVNVGTVPALAFAPEAQIIYLCGHAILHHRTLRLLWLHDIAETISFYGSRIDWDTVLCRGRLYDLVLPLKRVLPRIVEDWGAPVPVEVVEQLRNLDASPNETRVFAHLTADQTAGRRFWSDLSTLPNLTLRLRFALNNLFPSRAYMRERYRIRHPIMYPLHYIYRWVLGMRSALRRQI